MKLRITDLSLSTTKITEVSVFFYGWLATLCNSHYVSIGGVGPVTTYLSYIYCCTCGVTTVLMLKVTNGHMILILLYHLKKTIGMHASH